MSDQPEDVSLLTPQDASEASKEEDTHHAPYFRQVKTSYPTLLLFTLMS